jgi:parallel beta-helix repeat protein
MNPRMQSTLCTQIPLCGLILAAILLCPAILMAAEGRIPISEPTAAPIDQPGSYFLSNDITATCNAIEIAANDVTIDLDGHTIKAGAAAGCYAIRTTAAVSNVHIMNGKISQGSVGVWLYGAVSGGGDFSVKNLTITNVSGVGIGIVGDTTECDLNRARAVVEDNTIKTPGATSSAGIALTCVEGSRIERNQVRDAYHGIKLYRSKSTVVRNNAVAHCTSIGIEISESDRNIITGNAVTGNAWHGIRLSNGFANTLDNNNASGNTGCGFCLDSSADNLLLYNNASQNTETGFKFTGTSGSNVAYNTASENSEHGFLLLAQSSMNSIMYNTASGNVAHGICLDASGSNKISENTCSGNDGSGIYIAGLSSNNVLNANQCAANAAQGIFLSSTCTCNVVSNNRARGNAVSDYTYTACAGLPATTPCTDCNYDAGSNY